ncbi:class I SAM-dependent methyltransferase [Sphingomonas sp.]|uniref:class I SAM-dependent methyltransferase n=1 Tax=Sphingomonas sp. TaxID=28214 RepID=UPI001B188390|nr:class I SAM-dependent methyltransferase [Sphingomonas sp.]MBO9713464.1 class I SAM-dependent methyltransferase [Sphingomonas sp.]
MSNLLIHSMTEFSDIILASLQAAGVRNIVEIGAEFGGASQMLAAYCEVQGGTLTSIDPAPRAEFTGWAATRPNVRHVAAASLDVIHEMTDVDAWVIDGDHNYYTVINELRGANQVAQAEGKPLLAFLHDVSWPTGRRDMYYAPDRIPAEHRHEYSYEGGAKIGDRRLFEQRGFRGMGQFALATHEGGPRNGVLTAVEDFLAETRSDARPMAFANIPAVFGLGILFDSNAPWAPSIAQIVHPYHDNPLLASLELNRLRNWLEVIEWQDRAAA